VLVAKVVLKRLNRSDPDAQINALNSLLCSYRLDGHILGCEFRTVSLKNRLEAYVLLPAPDALDPCHRNQYINRRINELASLGLAEPQLVLMSKSPAESDDCRCLNSSAFTLFTNYLTVQSPVRCSD
jgi:predicted  nucleic acid-binding Zn ribbon protein